MHTLSNDTNIWNLTISSYSLLFTYNSNIYDTIEHNNSPINYLNDGSLPISPIVTSQTQTNEFNSVNYWAFALILFPIFTIFGNVLVVVSVYREKALHTVTNYFVVSLAISDITVAAVVMPFAIYLEFNQVWKLSERLCDFWVASDCMACTASILNLVAIAVDRYIAVTKPLKYARHKNPKRVAIMIVIVWLVSFFIALPIVSGVNKSDVAEYPRVPDQCAFFNNKFLIFSSLGSFFIPCIIIFAIYYRIYMVIMTQAKKTRKQCRPTLIIESTAAQHRSTADRLLTALYQERQSAINVPDKTSITLPGDDANETTITNHNAALETHRNSLMLKLTTTVLSANTISKASFQEQNEVDDDENTSIFGQNEQQINENNKADNENENENENEIEILSLDENKTSRTNTNDFKIKDSNSHTDFDHHIYRSLENIKARLKSKSNSDGNAIISIINRPSMNNKLTKRKAYSRMKKEHKATQTLIIVLICFLVCWLPFFVLNNIVNAFVKLLNKPARYLANDLALSICVWLGYINSFLNPIIYTIFNMEFRKSFAKILFSPCKFSPTNL